MASIPSANIASTKTNKKQVKLQKKKELTNRNQVSEGKNKKDVTKKPLKTKKTLQTELSGYGEENSTGILSSKMTSPDIGIATGTQHRSIESETESSSTYTESSSSSESASNSDISSDSDSDILTPEEAFQLPPGSLSLYPHVVASNSSRRQLNDDDDDTGPLGHRTCSGLLPDDEEDNELMRCSGGAASSSNFTMADMDRMMMMDDELRHQNRSNRDSEHRSGNSRAEGRDGGDSAGMLLDHQNLSSPSNLMMSHHDFSDEFDQTLFGACSAAALSPTGEAASSPLSCSGGVLSPNSTTIPVFKSPLKLYLSPSSSTAIGMFDTVSTSSSLGSTSSASSIPSAMANDKINNQPYLKSNTISQSIKTGYLSSSRTCGVSNGGSTTLKITPVMRPLSQVVSQQNVANNQQPMKFQPPPLLATNVSSIDKIPPLIGNSSGTSLSTFAAPAQISSMIASASPVKIIPSYSSDNTLKMANNDKDHLSFSSNVVIDDGLNNQRSSNKTHLDSYLNHHQHNITKDKSSDSIGSGNNAINVKAHTLTTSNVLTPLSSLKTPQYSSHHHSEMETQLRTGSSSIDIMNDISSSATVPMDIGGCVSDSFEEETPLEKVNPDIFFSSAFPVTTNPDS